MMDKLPDDYNGDMAVKQIKIPWILSDFIHGSSEMSLIFGLVGCGTLCPTADTIWLPMDHYPFIKITYKKTKTFYINK